MRVLVVNCSAPYYNLGAQKLADWHREQGHTVDLTADPGLFATGYDRVCLSVIFSWHAPIARDIAMRVKAGSEVWCGGPGMFALARWWNQATGLETVPGLDARFERQRGSYRMTFASRGCPVNCWFCVVPRLEGTAFTLDPEFLPAPILCDNNLSALPGDFQEHILERYRATGVSLLDCNSGFEPRSFTEETYNRWKPQLRGPWRFAYDTTDEGKHVRRMMAVLGSEPARRKQVYVLIGNEPIGACLERARQVIEWGGEPYCQPVMPLNALSRDRLIVRHDWTFYRLRDFARYFNRHLWRSLPLADYRPRQNETPPFSDLTLMPAAREHRDARAAEGMEQLTLGGISCNE
jgi:hypothetical protein